MPKIGELVVSLGIKVDQTAWNRARKRLDKFGTQIEQKIGVLRTRLGKSFAGIGKVLTSNLGLTLGAAGIGAALTSATKDALRFDEALTTLDINSASAMGTIDKVRERILALSKATGVSKESILEGAASFVALTGDGKAASKSMETFARVQLATAASMADIAGAAAALNQQFGIMPEDFEKAFSILVAGGKAGAVELRDMAQFSAELAAQFKTFTGGTGVGGLADMSAAFQIAAQNFGGKAAETATGLKRLFTAFSSPRTLKALKEFGIEVFRVGEDGQAILKSFPEIFDEMAQTKIVRDPRLLNKIFESQPARQAASAILTNVEAFRQLAKATRNADDIVTDVAKRQESSANKVTVAWNSVKIAISEALTPERVEVFAEAIRSVVPVIIKLIEGLSDVLRGWRFFFQEASKLVGPLDLELVKERTRAKKLTDKELDAELRGGVGPLILAGGLSPGAALAEQVLRPSSRSTSINVGSTNINVNVPAGADAQGIAGRVRQAMDQFWDNKVRDVTTATNG